MASRATPGVRLTGIEAASILASAKGRVRSSPLPPMPMDDERLLAGMPFVQYAGGDQAVMTRVVGRNALFGESELVVAADDGRRWPVGTDKIKRQLIGCGVDINSVLLWDEHSPERQAIIRALVYQPVKTLTREYCRAHRIKPKTAGEVLRDLVGEKRMHIGRDSAGRLCIQNAFLRQWIRRNLGRVEPPGVEFEPITNEAEALAALKTLSQEQREVARALAFEPTSDMSLEYCQAHELDFTKAIELARGLRREGQIIEGDHEGQLCVRGRPLRAVLRGRYKGKVVKSEGDALKVFLSADARDLALIRALAFYPGTPDASYLALNNVRITEAEAKSRLGELESKRLVAHDGSRYWVADRMLRAWMRGSTPRPRRIPLRARTTRHDVAMLIEGATGQHVARALRALAHEPTSKVDAAYCSREVVSSDEMVRGLAWLMLDIGVAMKTPEGKFALTEQVGEMTRRLMPRATARTPAVARSIAPPPEQEAIALGDIARRSTSPVTRPRRTPRVALGEEAIAEIERPFWLKLGG